MTIRERVKNAFSTTKGIDNSDALLIDQLNVFGPGASGSFRDKNPLTENIYETIANDISLGKFRHIIKEDDSFKLQEYSDLQLVLGRRPNELQSPSEFMNAFAYSLVKYGNAIAVPYYENNVTRKSLEIDDISYEYIDTRKGYTLKSIELVDVKNMTFGFGYRDDGKKYLLVKNSVTSEVTALPYDNIIHVRHQPKNVFDGDKMYNYNWNRIPDLLDKNITQMLTKLSQGGTINGVLKLKSGLTGQKGKSRSERVREFMQGVDRGVVLTDSNEEFQTLNKSFETVSNDSIESSLDYLYRMYGVNKNILNGAYNEQEFSAYYNHTIEPILAKIEQEFSYKLISMPKFRKGHRLIFRKKLIVGATLKDITAFLDKGMYQGWLTGNTIADLLGLDPYEGGDIRYTNLNAVALGNDVAPSTDNTSEGGDNNAKGIDS